MAFRMKHWIGTVVVGMALAAIWQLPPSSMRPREGSVTSALAIRRSRLSDDFKWTAESLLRVRWSDSLSALTLASAEGGVAVGLPSTELSDAHEAKVRLEVGALPRYVPGVVFGYFYQPRAHGRTADTPTFGRPRTETYVGTRDGTDYCLQVRVRRNPASSVMLELEGTAGLPPLTGAAGVCRLFLQYGMAGPTIHRWLEAGGARLGVEKGEKLGLKEAGPEPMSALVSIGPEDRRRMDRALWRRRRAFGHHVLASQRGPIETDQCVAGDEQACAYLFLSPALASSFEQRELEIVRRSPVLSLGGAPLLRSVAFDADYLLADLEAQFGADAFLRFWASTQAVEDAFESAFGVEVGAWMTAWVTSVSGTIEPGPGLPRSASSGTVLALSLLAGIAFLRNRRRNLT